MLAEQFVFLLEGSNYPKVARASNRLKRALYLKYLIWLNLVTFFSVSTFMWIINIDFFELCPSHLFISFHFMGKATVSTCSASRTSISVPIMINPIHPFFYGYSRADRAHSSFYEIRDWDANSLTLCLLLEMWNNFWWKKTL